MPVPVVYPGGDIELVDEADLDQAAAAGGRLEAPEETAAREEAAQYGTIGETVKGLGEQALSGATLGLSDVALSEIGGDEYRGARAARERQLGGLGTAAELVGAAAPLLLSGGTAAPVSGGVTAGRLAGAGVRAIGAPVRAATALGRGAEVGAGMLTRGVGVTGESILGRGLLRGTELAAGGAVEGGVYGAGQALSEAALAPGGDYDHLAEKMWAGAKDGALFGAITGGGLGFVGGAGTRAITKGYEKLQGAGGLKMMLENLATDRTVKALGARGSDVRRMGKNLDAAEANMKQMARDVLDGKLDDGTRVFSPGSKADDLAERVGRARDEAGEKLGALRKQVDDATVETIGIRQRIDDEVLAPLRASDIPDVARKAKKVESALAALDGGVMPLERLTKLRQDLDSVIYPKSTGAGLPPLPPAHVAELQKARAILEDSIEQATETVIAARAPQLSGQYGALKQQFRSFKQASQIAEKASLQDLGNRVLSPTDYLTGAVTGAAAFASGGVGALGSMATSAVAGAVHKGIRERTSSTLAVIADRMARADLKIDKSIKGYLTKAGDIRRAAIGEGAELEVEQKSRVAKALAQKKNENQIDAYRRRLKELAEFDPANLRDLGQATAQAPRATTAALTTLVRARDYLVKAAPTGLIGKDPLQPHLSKPMPDPVALERFARAVQTVDHPLSVLDDLQDGTITRDQVQVLKNVYPLLYNEIRTKVATTLADTKEPVPYLKRVRLGVLLDLPTDSSLHPARIKATQSIYQEAAVQEAEQGAAPAPVNMPVQLATPSQAAEFGLQEF